MNRNVASLVMAVGGALEVALLCPAQAVMIYADADGYVEGTDISNAFAGMTLSSVGRAAGLDGHVYAYEDALATTGNNVFGHNLDNHTEWYFDMYPAPYHPDDFALQVDFAAAAKAVWVDLICNSAYDYGRAIAYDANGAVVGVAESGLMEYGDVFTAMISSDDFQINYVIVGGIFANQAHDVFVDRVTADVIPEPGTVALLSLGGLVAFRRRRSR